MVKRATAVIKIMPDFLDIIQDKLKKELLKDIIHYYDTKSLN